MVVAKFLLVLISITASASGAELYCFGAKWCEPCREMQPALDRLTQEGFPVRKIDVDQHGDVAKKYGIQTVPACVLIDGTGRVIDQINQATDYDTLRRMLAHYKVDPIPATVRGQSPKPPTGIRVASDTRSPAELATQNEPAPNFVNATAPLATAAAAAPLDPRAAAMASSVRLRVEDEEGHSFGTGTMIDVHGEEGLILTCGHIFRSSDGKGRIVIDRFDSPNSEPTTGSLISYDIDLDVALVSMKLKRPMQVAKLAPLQYKARQREPVFSVGCNGGDPPTLMDGQVNQIDKYLGPPNITVSGRPVSGRSGGGLFNAQGEMIGVCSAADPEIDEGLYAALPRVYYELDRNGLSFVYQQSSEEKPIAQFASNPAVPTTNSVPPVNQISSPDSLLQPLPLRPQPANALPTVPAAVGQQKRELVCVLKDGEGVSGKAFVIENPSEVLLEYLNREAKKE